MSKSGIHCTLLLLTSALSCSAAGAAEQRTVERSFAPSPKSCSEVQWSATSLRAFPHIANGCQDVERRNGKSFAKFVGTVQDVRDGKRIAVELPGGEELAFRPTPNTMLYVDSRRMRFGEIQEGTKLPFYIPEDRFRAELQPDPKRLAFVVVPIVASSVSSP